MWPRPSSSPIAFIIIRLWAIRSWLIFTCPGAGSAGNQSLRKALQAYSASSMRRSWRAWLWACLSCSARAAMASAAPKGMKASTARPIGPQRTKSLPQGCCPHGNAGKGFMSAPGATVPKSACIICVMTAPSMCLRSRPPAAAKAWASSCLRSCPGPTASSSTIRRPSFGT